jgi:hypothetical protein
MQKQKSRPMMINHLQVAIQPGFPWLGIAVSLPTLFTLFSLAVLLGKSRGERFENLISGFLFAVIGMTAFAIWFDPLPNTWADQNFEWINIGIVPIAAAVGVIATVLWRKRLESHSVG